YRPGLVSETTSIRSCETPTGKSVGDVGVTTVGEMLRGSAPRNTRLRASAMIGGPAGNAGLAGASTVLSMSSGCVPGPKIGGLWKPEMMKLIESPACTLIGFGMIW